MCVRFCEFWTARLLLFLISIASIIISFILGPLHTIFFILGLRKDLKELFKTEYDYALLLCFILIFIWIIFIASSFLFCACVYKKTLFLNIYVVMIIADMVISLAVALRYVIYCSFVDKYCFDHKPDRKTNDKGGALGLFIAAVLYILSSIVILFVVCTFKIAIKLRQ